MHKVGDIIELNIEKIVFGGEGLGFYEDKAIFVPLSAVGDRVKVRIISTKKTYSRGLIIELLKKSEDRVENSKISFKENNGCNFYHLKYEKQLEYKNKMLIELFKNMAKIDISEIFTGIIGAKNDKNYRNKVAMPFFIHKGSIKTGFYERKSHDIFLVEDDILQSEISKKVNDIVCSKLNEHNFTVYDDKKAKGFLKHLIIRNNEKGEVLLAIVTNKKKELDKLKNVLEMVYNENSYIKSVYVSVKNFKNNTIIGDENIHLFGEEYITENLFDINFKIYLDSFFQINMEQVIKLYTIAKEYIEGDNKTLIDAYSGTGTIAMLLSKKAKFVYAIEQIKSAVLSGKLTAKENNIKNVKFLCNKVENEIEKLLQKSKIDYILFDPPRKGLTKDIIKSVCENNIEKIIYISCEPSTFVRDLNDFMEKGYSLTKLGAVDMFPQTNHIEIVAIIERK